MERYDDESDGARSVGDKATQMERPAAWRIPATWHTQHLMRRKHTHAKIHTYIGT